MPPRGCRALLSFAFVATFALASCSGTASTLTPGGPGARPTNFLWWLFFGISVVVFLIVTGLLLYGIRRRGSLSDRPPTSAEGTVTPIVVGGVVIPLIVLIAVFFFTMHALAQESQPPSAQLSIDVVGHRWWWELHYPQPNGGFTTANEMHIPVGQPVLLRVTSDDVIHSVWIPSLHPKMDAIPGQVNEFQIQADDAGVWRGECAEYCGLQHAHMNFVVVAQPEADYERWVADQESMPPPVPISKEAQRGQQVFLSSPCADCHTIRGTDARGTIGPDLTHVASRSMLAADTIPNNRGYLMGWILDPQHVKPGTLMPATGLTGPQAQAVATYLETLR